MVKIIFMRHGQTNDNKLNIVQGRRDSKLNIRGYFSSIISVNKLLHFKIDKIYSSPLIRATTTAKIIKNILNIFYYYNLKINIDNRIIEKSYGIYEGKTLKEWRLAQKLNQKNTVEKRYQIEERMISFIDYLEKKYKTNDTILVISHGASIRILLEKFNLKPDNKLISNNNICVINYNVVDNERCINLEKYNV